uniref:stabilizer of axonemal microtubules 1-like n=1 Tax=Jaculus jaculus TaxID=51337 RepID=UPI00064D39B1|nr:stabilizer of axonemal microtubules 1-like [Jaculus jaculus]
MALLNRKCICDLCSCGRHHCPHIPTKIYEKTESPCHLSEYTEKYPYHHSYLPSESFKPKAEYHKGPVPMEGLSTTKRDFVPHKTVPVRYQQNDNLGLSQDNMDFLTTYRQHYNHYPVCRVNAIKPRDNKNPCPDKMEYVPTYRAHYLPWRQERRPMICPPPNFLPGSGKFDHKTTHQEDFTRKTLVETASYKPPFVRYLTNIPLEDETSYKASYVAHPIKKLPVHKAEDFKPCEIPFDGLTTHKDSYKGLTGEPAKMWIPPPVRPLGPEKYISQHTEFRDQFQAWPTPKLVPKEPIPYDPPEGKLNLLTTVQADYSYPNATPAKSCRPVPKIKKNGHFEGSSTTKDDYKHWTVPRREPVKPVIQVKFQTAPMDYMTTNRAHYVRHMPANTKSCKPVWTGPPENVPVEGQTTYSISFTPKKLEKCPASYSEPPGYVFEEVNSMGHRLYRPISHTVTQQNSNLSMGDVKKF